MVSIYALLMDSPTDNADYRISKIEGLLKYSWAIIKTGEVDPAYPLLNWIMDELSLDDEERHWLCFLYGHFYHTACAYWVFINYPNPYIIDTEDLKKWEKENYRRLEYQDDRQRQRGTFAMNVESYLEHVKKHGSQRDFMESFMEHDKYQTYLNMYEWIRDNIKGFGRYTAFYYLETLARCIGYNIDAPEIFYKEAESPRLGLQYAIDYFPTYHRDLDYEYLDNTTDKYLEVLRNHTDTPEADYMYLETCLCAYKGLWKRKRYIGYYIDRSQEEIINMENNTGEDFSRLWQARNEVFPHYLLGEICGWQGRRKYYYHIFANTGRLINLDLVENDIGGLSDVPSSLCA